MCPLLLSVVVGVCIGEIYKACPPSPKDTHIISCCALIQIQRLCSIPRLHRHQLKCRSDLLVLSEFGSYPQSVCLVRVSPRHTVSIILRTVTYKQADSHVTQHPHPRPRQTTKPLPPSRARGSQEQTRLRSSVTMDNYQAQTSGEHAILQNMSKSSPQLSGPPKIYKLTPPPS